MVRSWLAIGCLLVGVRLGISSGTQIDDLRHAIGESLEVRGNPLVNDSNEPAGFISVRQFRLRYQQKKPDTQRRYANQASEISNETAQFLCVFVDRRRSIDAGGDIGRCFGDPVNRLHQH